MEKMRKEATYQWLYKNLMEKVSEKNSRLQGLKGTKEAKSMSLLELMAKVHEEDAETVLAAKDYIRKPNEANLLHLMYELVDGQMIRESIIEKYFPYQNDRDNMRNDVLKANCNCYDYDDCENEDNCECGYPDEDEKTVYELCFRTSDGEIDTEEIYGSKEEAIEAAIDFINCDRRNGIKVTYFINKYTLCDQEEIYYPAN